jgi:hypothetical protein
MTARERARLIAMYGVIAGLIGAVEALSLLPQEIHGLSRTTGFWGLVSRFNVNTAGLVIVGLFLATCWPPCSSCATPASRKNGTQPPVRHARRHLVIRVGIQSKPAGLAWPAGVWVARSLGLRVCLPEAGQGPPQLSA